MTRAMELLWVIARCDVENVNAHRATALAMLQDVESRATAMAIDDLYREVVADHF